MVKLPQIHTWKTYHMKIWLAIGWFRGILLNSTLSTSILHIEKSFRHDQKRLKRFLLEYIRKTKSVAAPWFPIRAAYTLGGVSLTFCQYISKNTVQLGIMKSSVNINHISTVNGTPRQDTCRNIDKTDHSWHMFMLGIFVGNIWSFCSHFQWKILFYLLIKWRRGTFETDAIMCNVQSSPIMETLCHNKNAKHEMKINAHINMEWSPEDMSFQFIQQIKLRSNTQSPKNDHSYQT